MEQNGKIVNRYNEKQAKTYNGFVMLVAVLLVIAAGIALMVLGIIPLRWAATRRCGPAGLSCSSAA